MIRYGTIRYRAGYNYVLAADYAVKTWIRPEMPIATEFIGLTLHGALYIKRGYAWDGPSGPAIDTQSMMRPSLIHDALYQLMREGFLDRERWRQVADEEFRSAYEHDAKIIASRGSVLLRPLRRLIARFRGPAAYGALRLAGESSASPEGERPTLLAP